jgi:hypothetical protein
MDTRPVLDCAGCAEADACVMDRACELYPDCLIAAAEREQGATDGLADPR